ncbi:M56 family metallopeptidase [Pyxidicoccus trucidator]|uniref:M56 family metallopeptidase n=1 Tax=Pyxidicoccus trucidator TaxID=2709662 RepID=UPI0013DAC109|nr:M56 family metallopeptidase [Pyxidicoccus trucidator]
MDTGWLSDVGGWASTWPAGLWRASWQGALCAALVWALTRTWPRMPASLRAGLWWLVALKFVVSLGWLPAVPLPVLPASVASSVEGLASTVEATARSGQGAPETVRDEPRARNELPDTRQGVRVDVVSPERSPERQVGVSREAVQPEGPGHEGVARPSPRRTELPVVGDMTGDRVEFSGLSVTSAGAPALSSTLWSVPWSRGLAWALLAAWLAGVLWHLRSHVKGWASMRRLRQSARPLAHPVLESEVRALSSAAKLWRVPRLLVSESVVSPLATGLVDPVVVLPAKAVRRLPVEALRMALAHELAHLRRGDLWLGWVPALAEALLFFHPLARRAAREYALAREEACDAEALRLTGAEPADYGELLLAFGVARGAGTAAAHGASAHVHALHRRLSMLEHVDAVPARSRRLLKVALSALGLAALVPFQVVAQESAAKAGTPAAAPAEASQAKSAAQGSAASPAKAAAPSTKAASGEDVASAPAASGAKASPKVAVTPATPSVAVTPVTPRVAMTPVTPRVAVTPVTPRVAMTPAVPPVPPIPHVGPVPPIPPIPRLAMVGALAVPAMPSMAAVPPKPPAPPRDMDEDDDDSSYVLLADNMAMMNGSTVDLNLAGMFKKPGQELLYVRQKGNAFIIRDASTLNAVRTALQPTRDLGKAQGDLGGKQGELGRQQGELGHKQGELGLKQSALGLKQAELAHKQAGIHLEERRADALPDAERERREAELKKQEQALEQEMAALEKQQEALNEQQEALGREQEKLGEQQEKLGEEQEKLGEQQEARSREAEKKVRGLIDEALRKGLGQPLPT